MHTVRIVTKTTPRILTLICGLALFFASCEKVDFDESSDQAVISDTEAISIEEQSNLLQQVYHLPTKGMDDYQIQTYYQEAFSGTSTEDRMLLNEQLASIASDQAVGHRGIHARSTPTIISPAGGTSDFGTGITTNRGQFLVGDEGEVSVYEQSGSGYTKVQSLTFANGAGTILSAAGDWLAVGYPGSFANNFADAEVVLFRYSRGTWEEKQTLTAPGLILFGEDVAMDYKSMAVLARESGASSIIIKYSWNGRTWTESDRMGSGNFFWDMDMDREIIVANGFKGADFNNSKVHIYISKLPRGRKEQTIPIPGALSRQISIDNGVILASVAFKPNFAGINNTGFIYSFAANRKPWSLTAEITPPIPFRSSAQGVGLKIRGNKALVSHPIFGFSAEEGDAVFVFEGSGSNWSLTETLTPSDDNGLGSIYGIETGLEIFGSKVLVGATGRNGAAGKVYVH
ncbi:MAG: hypothetical protein HRU41_40920 [Saprospiraceae bacterium]|nr:hypothetical protein [Saprospiraceae bacterium]